MGRRIVAALLIIVASILAPLAIGGYWAQQTFTDTDAFVETVAPLGDDPEVRQAFATEVSAALVEAADVETRLTDAVGNLDGPLAQLVDSEVVISSIASGINGAIESGVQSYSQSDQFGELWLAVATGLQAQFVNLLERDTESAAVTLEDGQIVLDTKVAAEKVQAALAAKGVPFTDQLDKVPGREVVLADAPNLQLVADALAIFLPVATWLWAVVALMFLAGILLWRPRARGVMWAGLGLALGGGLTYVALDLGQAQLIEAAPSDNFSDLLGALTSTLLRFLVNALLVVLSLGVAMIVAGWLAGGTASGRRIRTQIAGAAHGWGAALGDGPVGRFTSAHPMFVPTLRGIVLVLALAYLIAADRLSPAEIFWTAVAAGAALLVIEVVEGSGLSVEEHRAGALVASADGEPAQTQA